MAIELAPTHSKPYAKGLVWLRRDLRLHDNAALHHAAQQCQHLHLCFVFDSELLAGLHSPDRRLDFVLAALAELEQQLQAQRQDAQLHLICPRGPVPGTLAQLAQSLGVQAVFCGHDPEPQAWAQERQVRGALANVGCMLHSHKDQQIFLAKELATEAKGHGHFKAFKPYRRAWLAAYAAAPQKPYPSARAVAQVLPAPVAWAQGVPSLAQLGFEPSNLAHLQIPTGSAGAATMWQHFQAVLPHYHERANYPGRRGVSYLSLHLRFGTASLRQVLAAVWPQAQMGLTGPQEWRDALIWREFYSQLLEARPEMAEGKCYYPIYDKLRWDKSKAGKARFQAWCEGRTGYPLVDAAMRQLLHSGYMHQRLRLITGSFLIKHLGLDWRWGEAFFAEKLNDYDTASNIGNWQWLAGCGAEAQAHYRIYNPVLQSEKYDPEGRFIRRYVPELAALPLPHLYAPWAAPAELLAQASLELGRHYPAPIIDLASAREASLRRYRQLKK